MENETSNSKFAWSEISRATPPKRDAEERKTDFKEIYGLFDEQTVRAQASRCIQCGVPTCRTGCPLCNRIPEWLALAAEGKFAEAAQVCGITSNMPELCARVCPQERLCEGACVLNAYSEPVAIGAIEKFLNEYALEHGIVDVTIAPANGLRVAVIGAGPGGLSCADELAKRGYEVTVFEALPHAGGLLVYGIPAFKLRKDVVQRRVELYRRRGISFRFNTSIGKDIRFQDLQKDFDAIFVGFGAQKPKALDVSGAELAGIYDALPFLAEKNVNVDQEQKIDVKGKRVAVLGGGDTAMDCLRTAIRAGAKEAICLYRRDFANMPGSRKEYHNAIEEGAQFSFLTNPTAIEGENGRVKQVRCIRMELGEPDAQGRRKPRPVPNSEFVTPVEVVIVAYGFDPYVFPPGSGLDEIAVNEWRGIIVDKNQMTSIPGVFAGGDATRGPSLVSHAVVDGRRAALGIHEYLASRRDVQQPEAKHVCGCTPAAK